MYLTLKNKLSYSLAFGSYLGLVELFFGSAQFLGNNISQMVYSSLTLLTSSILLFILLQVHVTLSSKQLVRRVLFSASFPISAIVTATVLWFMLNPENGHFFIHLSAFLIASLLPVLLSVLLFIFEEAESKIRASVVQTDHGTEGKPENMVQTFVLENEAGKQILKVTTDRLICFEANDNYVVTYYLDKDGNLKKSMDRSSLKKIDDILQSSGIAFERVHKSYIVNPEYICAVKGKAQAYKLELRHFDTLVPVSRSFDVSAFEVES